MKLVRFLSTLTFTKYTKGSSVADTFLNKINKSGRKASYEALCLECDWSIVPDQRSLQLSMHSHAC